MPRRRRCRWRRAHVVERFDVRRFALLLRFLIGLLFIELSADRIEAFHPRATGIDAGLGGFRADEVTRRCHGCFTRLSIFRPSRLQLADRSMRHGSNHRIGNQWEATAPSRRERAAFARRTLLCRVLNLSSVNSPVDAPVTIAKMQNSRSRSAISRSRVQRDLSLPGRSPARDGKPRFGGAFFLRRRNNSPVWCRRRIRRHARWRALHALSVQDRAEICAADEFAGAIR